MTQRPQNEEIDTTGKNRFVVYVIRVLPDGPVKIGLSNDPVRRFLTIQTTCGPLMTFVGIVPGSGPAQETALHKRFAAFRLHHEWFRPEPELLAWIKDSVVPPTDADTAHIATALSLAKHHGGGNVLRGTAIGRKPLLDLDVAAKLRAVASEDNRSISYTANRLLRKALARYRGRKVRVERA